MLRAMPPKLRASSHQARRCGTAFVALALLAGIVSGCGRGEVARPDLVLISIDTLRPDRLACYGGAADVGTALCALGDAGVRYAWAFSAAASTPPSIASLHTSRLPRDHGVAEVATSHLADETVTLAEALATAGYATAAFVANPVLAHGRGFEQGFAVYDDKMKRRERNRPLFEREARELTDAALAWVRVARSPWFLWIHYQDPHGPYATPYAAIARDADTEQDASALPVLADESGWRGIPAYQVLDDARMPATYEARYADEIRHLDAQLARLFAGLDARERRPSILLTADHGEAFGEDEFWFAHGHSLAIDQIRIPLFWRPSEPEPGRVVATSVSNLDVAPTLLAAAGLPGQPSFDGIPLAAREAGPDAAPIFAEHRLRVAVVMGNHYFARDRRPLVEPEPEPVTGGLIPPLPPRTATLAVDGRFSGYTPVAADATPALEALVAAFLAQPPASGAASQRVLDDASREALRALGYLE
jgi:arylsulfatase A-like enzyme